MIDSSIFRKEKKIQVYIIPGAEWIGSLVCVCGSLAERRLMLRAINCGPEQLDAL